jgi:DNA adenine methylase
MPGPPGLFAFRSALRTFPVVPTSPLAAQDSGSPVTAVLPAPFLRWAGGKRRLLDKILPTFPSFDQARNRFYEPFVGGGAVMLALGVPEGNTFVPGKRLVINDVNPDLIATYTVIRDSVDDLIPALRKLARNTTKNGFETVKKSRPKTSVGVAARFIYLNKTCFNGLWRVNSRGEFNVPWGKLTNPQVLDEPLLHACSSRLQGASIRCGSVSTSVSDAKAGDLVYLDPPYIPLSASSSFSKYAKDDYGILDHYQLAGLIQGLTDRGVRVILSNSDTPLTRSIYGPVLNLWQLSVHRSISAASASRGRVDEVLGFNYEPTPHTSDLVAVSSATSRPARLLQHTKVSQQHEAEPGEQKRQ